MQKQEWIAAIRHGIIVLSRSMLAEGEWQISLLVVQATGLAGGGGGGAAGSSGRHRRRRRCFVSLELGEELLTTRTVRAKAEPVWNETLRLSSSVRPRAVTACLFDRRLLGKAALIAKGTVDLTACYSGDGGGSTGVVWVAMPSAAGAGAGAMPGIQLQLDVTVTRTSDAGAEEDCAPGAAAGGGVGVAPERALDASLGMLDLRVYHAEGLHRWVRGTGSSSSISAFVVVQCGNKTLRTSTMRGRAKVVWNQDCRLWIGAKEQRSYTIRVIVYAGSKRAKPLGTAYIALKDLLDYAEHPLWLDLSQAEGALITDASVSARGGVSAGAAAPAGDALVSPREASDKEGTDGGLEAGTTPIVLSLDGTPSGFDVVQAGSDSSESDSDSGGSGDDEGKGAEGRRGGGRDGFEPTAGGGRGGGGGRGRDGDVNAAAAAAAAAVDGSRADMTAGGAGELVSDRSRSDTEDSDVDSEERADRLGASMPSPSDESDADGARGRRPVRRMARSGSEIGASAWGSNSTAGRARLLVNCRLLPPAQIEEFIKMLAADFSVDAGTVSASGGAVSSGTRALPAASRADGAGGVALAAPVTMSDSEAAARFSSLASAYEAGFVAGFAAAVARGAAGGTALVADGGPLMRPASSRTDLSSLGAEGFVRLQDFSFILAWVGKKCSPAEASELFSTLDKASVGYVRTDVVVSFLTSQVLANTPLSLQLVTYMVDGREGLRSMMRSVAAGVVFMTACRRV